MYAVVSSGGKQYRVEAGTTLTMERNGAEAGASLTFDRVLLIGDGDQVTVGTPVVPGASVSATVLGEQLGPKLVIFKFKQKVKYRRRTGHRQKLIRVRIDDISAGGAKREKAQPAKAEPEADAAEASVQAEPKPKAPKRTAKPKAEPKAEAASEAKPKTTRRTAKPKAADGETAADAPKAEKARARKAPKAEE
ncbi:MAG TPA: 50S ribosomal protein L21 [Candidatus Limnocylindria bacterium]|nr:50S ribosomal protein L21 [Candidatus Limnocylindria bacterium]